MYDYASCCAASTQARKRHLSLNIYYRYHYSPLTTLIGDLALISFNIPVIYSLFGSFRVAGSIPNSVFSRIQPLASYVSTYPKSGFSLVEFSPQ